MKPIALDASETRAPVPAAERARWPWAVALAGVALVALAGAIFLIPTEGARPAESVRIGRVPDWPEIKNGVHDYLFGQVSRVAGTAGADTPVGQTPDDTGQNQAFGKNVRY